MTNPIFDIHHHGNEPRANSVNSIMAGYPLPAGDYLFSIGIHPWHTDNGDLNRLFEQLTEIMTDPRVVAVGETGLDRLRGGDITIQSEIFNRHLGLAIETGKPLIIHTVRATDILLPQLKKAASRIPVVIHGFRGKPAEALQLINAGAFISLGERFNPATAAIIPDERLLAETDESTLTIQSIISKIAEARHLETPQLEEQIILNTRTVLTASKS